MIFIALDESELQYVGEIGPGTLVRGDCLTVMPHIRPGSIDMVLADLPYGTSECKWDSVIPLVPLWKEYKRIIKRNGAILLFGSQPFTSILVCSNLAMFKYCWEWNKKFGIPAHAKRRPMKIHEDICVFSDGTEPYYPQMTKRDVPIRSGGNKGGSLTSALRTRQEGWSKTYDMKFPTSIIPDFPRELGRTVHPTQKPVALMEYLILTYTAEGDIVLDNAAGSFPTGVACLNTNRKFIGIEKYPLPDKPIHPERNPNYFDGGVTRMHKRAVELGLLDIA